MSHVTDQLQQTLKAHNLSVTAPRRIVFAALGPQKPLTMTELIGSCNGVNRASIYRTVALFEKLGVVQRVQIGWKYKLELSDAFQEHHHHLFCTRCGRVTVIPEDQAFEKQLQASAQAHGFLLRSHQLELSGLCLRCQRLPTTA